mmetsp:Transcript_107920/g.343997  ORF Transcript_107920/g.343997 Transcript_107920/m.343997 type:complete len:397 (+) Transcript_107920:53-1243(+)
MPCSVASTGAHAGGGAHVSAARGALALRRRHAPLRARRPGAAAAHARHLAAALAAVHRQRRPGRRAATAAGLGLAGAVLGAVAASQPAHAGAFTKFMSDILPVREAQRQMAQVDFALRDGSTSFMDAVLPPPKPAPEVPDALGAEAEVLPLADAAARSAGLDMQAAAAREAILLEEEPRRLRGRAAAGLFESELLGSITLHLAERTDSYAFRGYCRWRAYVDALPAAGREAVAAAFKQEFGRRLLAAGGPLAVAGFPVLPQFRASPADAQALLEDIKRALQAIVAAGLCTRAQLDADEVLVDVWASGGSKDLVLPAVVEGDPLVDAQMLLSEEFAAPILPDPIVAALQCWLDSGSGPIRASVDGYYVQANPRRKADKQAMTYVRKQRLLQLTLRPA